MAAPRKSRNAGRAVSRLVTRSITFRESKQVNNYVVQHIDGSSHISTQPCAVCKRIAASSSELQFTTEDDGMFVRFGGNDF
jgi:hypothetical protein